MSVDEYGSFADAKNLRIETIRAARAGDNVADLTFSGCRMVYPSEHEKSLIGEWLFEKRGFFVEVGAGEPVRGSQSHHLELRGWSGLLIEPSFPLAESLRRSRKAEVVEAACAGPGSPPQLSLWTQGFSAQKAPLRGVGPGHSVRVQTVTLDGVLARAGIEAVDFVSVDVEGMEPDVLEGFDVSRFRPRLVLVDDRSGLGRCIRIMRNHNYSLVRRTGHNAWFVPNYLDWTTRSDRLLLAWHYGPARLGRRLLRGG